MELAGATVLVVDDEPLLNLTMSLLLERAGAVVPRASNGVEALAIVERQAVDVMVCDQNMPGMDGKTLLRLLVERERAVPTLLFVNGVDREDDSLLEWLHVLQTLVKPVQPATLIKAVQAVLAGVPKR